MLATIFYTITMTLDGQAPHEHTPNPELKHTPMTPAVILNFGSQHTLEIQDAMRDQGVDCVVLPYNTPANQLVGYKAVVLSGGSESVYDPNAPKPDPGLYDLQVPILGICYGAQLLAKQAGANVLPGKQSEFGQHVIKRMQGGSSIVFTTQESQQIVWMNHGDGIHDMPSGYVVDAQSNDGMIAAFRSNNNKRIGVQFHPEVMGNGRTQLGSDMWARFLFDVAKIEPTFEHASLQQRIDQLAKVIGGKQVLAFLSGGVDSTVMAALLAKATKPDQIFAVHVDHGFMRSGESAEVQEALSRMGVKIHNLQASEFFLNATTSINGHQTLPLHQATDPELKRKIIGDAFIQFQKVAATDLGLKDDYLLAQGSIRPDLIESGSHGTVTIKSHHNDSPLARELRAQGRVVEPLADLYKPGVRALGRALDLPHDLVSRQPFPGPGLAIRILCATGFELAAGSKSYDQMMQPIKSLVHRLGKFASDTINTTVIPVRSVGQRGDARSYGQTVVLSGQQNWPDLMKLSAAITASERDVTRVTYAFGEPIKFRHSSLLTRTMPGRQAADQLRIADAITRHELTNAGLDAILQQVPIILLPTGITSRNKRSIVLRPFLTTNYMTGTPAVPGSDQMPLPVLHKIVSRILGEVPGISRVLYDLTPKPPGTTEWE
jgi:GMP synthase (glutamine-hydrolysing)